MSASKMMKPTLLQANRRWKCLKCDFSTLHLSSLKSHMISQHAATADYHCEKCSFGTFSASRLKKHAEDHFMQMQCTYCDFTTLKFEKLHRHQSLPHKISCHQCKDYKTTTSYILTRHLEKCHELSKEKKCLYCDFVGQAQEVRNHMSHVHSSIRRYQCPKCPYVGKTYSRAQKHIHNMHEKKKIFNCKICDYSSRTRFELIRHKNSNHKNEMAPWLSKCPSKVLSKRILKKYRGSKYSRISKCDICDELHSSPYHLNQHIRRVHNQEKNYDCTYCEYKCFDKSSMNKHISFVHEKKLSCDICNKDFDLEENLKTHILTDHNERNKYLCENCGFKCSRESQLKSHIHLQCGSSDFKPKSDLNEQEQQGHNKALPEFHVSVNEAGYRVYQCPTCPYTAEKPSRVQYHYNAIHERIRNCRFCDFETMDMLCLDIHISNEHKKEGMFVCSICNNKYKDGKSLVCHINTVHETTRKYNCPHCEYKTNKQKAFNFHVKNIHDTERKCPLCEFITKDKIIFNEHLYTVHTEAPLEKDAHAKKASEPNVQLNMLDEVEVMKVIKGKRPKNVNIDSNKNLGQKTQNLTKASSSSAKIDAQDGISDSDQQKGEVDSEKPEIESNLSEGCEAKNEVDFDYQAIVKTEYEVTSTDLDIAILTPRIKKEERINPFAVKCMVCCRPNKVIAFSDRAGLMSHVEEDHEMALSLYDDMFTIVID